MQQVYRVRQQDSDLQRGEGNETNILLNKEFQYHLFSEEPFQPKSTRITLVNSGQVKIGHTNLFQPLYGLSVANSLLFLLLACYSSGVGISDFRSEDSFLQKARISRQHFSLIFRTSQKGHSQKYSLNTQVGSFELIYCQFPCIKTVFQGKEKVTSG